MQPNIINKLTSPFHDVMHATKFSLRKLRAVIIERVKVILQKKNEQVCDFIYKTKFFNVMKKLINM